MEFEISFVPEFLEVKTSGSAELKTFRHMIEAIYSHEKWCPGRAMLLDHSGVNGAPLTSEDIRAIADYGHDFHSRFDGGKVAVVVSRDLEFGISRMWQVFASKEGSSLRRVFRSRDAAIAWLNEA